MKHLVIAYLLAIGSTGCGGASPKPVTTDEVHWNTEDKEETPNASSPDAVTPPSPQVPDVVSVEAVCKRFLELKQEGCGWTERFPEELAEPDVCEKNISNLLDPNTPRHAASKSMVGCWALNCDAAVQCMATAMSSGAKATARVCGEPGSQPIEVDNETWEARRWQNTKRFSELSTSEEEPVELCGIDGELSWITQVQCDDGSIPYKTRADANGSRDSYLQRGGRCNSVLDRFSVQCPESTYIVYVDRYVCPR